MDGLSLLARLQEAEKKLSTVIEGSSIHGGTDVRHIAIGGQLARAPQQANTARPSRSWKPGIRTAMPAFAPIVGQHSDDALAGFHLKQLLNGATGIRIELG